MLAPLSKRIFEHNIVRPRTSFTKIYGLNFMQKKSSLLFDKKFGFPGTFHWRTPRIRKIERPAHSRRHLIAIVQQFNDCVLLPKMRSIVDNNYIFGSDLEDKIKKFLLTKKKSETLQCIKTIIGLPCRGQRTKTNANTCKKKFKKTQQKNMEAQKYLQLISQHRSLSLITYAKTLSNKHKEMSKFRQISELMRQRRYSQPSSSTKSNLEHYEEIYAKINRAKKWKKNISR
jgi:hypothetical protein